MSPWFLAFFFSVFHAFGGAAFGRGARTVRSEPQNAATLLLWGTLMGLVPFIFDWFFLLRAGQVTYGLIGPVVFAVAAAVSASLWTGAFDNLDGKALAASAFGGTAFLLGLAAVPILIGAARATAATLGEVAFGVCWELFFLGIGGGMAWTGLMALRHGRTFDQEARSRQRAAGRSRARPRPSNRVDEPKS
jgi:hypothetical protein